MNKLLELLSNGEIIRVWRVVDLAVPSLLIEERERVTK
jgi:hypothetical protein